MKHLKFSKTLLIVLYATAFTTSYLFVHECFGQEWTESQKEVWNMEEKYWEYVQKGDIEGYMTLFHPDFIGWPSYSNELVNKDSLKIGVERILNSFKSGSLSVKPKPLAVNIFGNIAVVFYSHRFVGEDLKGEKVSGAERITHTWMKRNGKWKIIDGMSLRL